MPFEVPEDANVLLANGEPKSANTIKTYTSRLNKLSNYGYDTVEKLLKKSKEVLKIIDDLAGPGDSDTTRLRKREFLSAIFFVTHTTPLKKKKAYYDAFQKAKHSFGKKLQKDGTYV
jgi:hypothetical protein